MRIIHNTLSKSRLKLVQKFLDKQTNLEYLGSGATAKVFALDSATIVRVQRESEDYPTSPYTDWATFCVGCKSKHLPKIKFLAELDGGSRVVTVMERLKPVGYRVNTEKGWDTDDEVWYLEDYLNTTERLDIEALGGIASTISPSAMQRLRANLGKTGIEPNDLHRGNVMFRTQGQKKVLVITDPVC